MLKRGSRNRLFLAVFLIAASLCIGMTGFTMLEHFKPADAFYMTVITVSSVGLASCTRCRSRGGCL